MNVAVTVALVVLAVFLPVLMHGMAVYILNRAHTSGSTIMALLERLRVAQAGLVGSLIIAGLVVNGALGRPLDLDPFYLRLLTAAALFIIALPSGVFIWLWYTNQFGGDAD